jgi:hypothetical protein
LLGLHRLKGLYSRENITEAIVTVVKTYKIIGKISYFILDNVGLNNTCVSAIIKQLNIKDIKEHYCLRCLGHILNLLVKVILFSENPEVFKKDITTTAILRDKKAVLQY